MTTVCRRVARTDSVDLSSDASPVRRSPTTVAAESDYDSARSESDVSDREAENGETPRKIDHDEDRSNPQYIPKRGTFYEHDDRTAASEEVAASGDGESPAPSTEPPREEAPDRRGRPRRAPADRWSHDKYNENEQTPKSREELISTYGYDIRGEDGPPHARRVRKYARGPNKYMRQWEDEEAYRRQATHRRSNAGDSVSDIASQTSKERPRETRSPRQEASPRPERRNGGAGGTRSPREDKITVTASSNGSASQRKVTSTTAKQSPKPKETTSTKKESPPAAEKEKISDDQTQVSKPPTPPAPPAAASAAPAAVATPAVTSVAESRPSTKRYSSLRQKLTEGYAPAPPRPHAPVQTPPALSQPAQTLPQPTLPHRYVQEYQPPASAQLHQQTQILHQVHLNTQVNQQPHGPSAPHQGIQQQQIQQQQIQQQQIQPQQIQQLPQQQIQLPPPQQLQQLAQQQIPQQQLQQIPQQQLQQMPQQQLSQQILQQQMVSHPHSLHNIPGQMPPAQAYPQQAMMQAQYMQSGSNAVYAGAPVYAAPPPAHAAYPHQLYQHHNFTHQSGGGVTYYGPLEHEQPPPRTRRPTSAIPIVPPPAPKSGAATCDKESIDRIVDNMFVRKQRPAAHAPPTDKTEISPSPSVSSVDTRQSDDADTERSEREIEERQEESKPDTVQSEPEAPSVEA